MHLFRACLAPVFALAVACPALAADPLSGKTFVSVRKLERGLSPQGVALGHWQLQFRDGRYSWDHSDVSESGAYRYDPRTHAVTASSGNGRTRIVGSYDPRTGGLTWQREKYLPKGK